MKNAPLNLLIVNRLDKCFSHKVDKVGNTEKWIFNGGKIANVVYIGLPTRLTHFFDSCVTQCPSMVRSNVPKVYNLPVRKNRLTIQKCLRKKKSTYISTKLGPEKKERKKIRKA